MMFILGLFVGLVIGCILGIVFICFIKSDSFEKERSDEAQINFCKNNSKKQLK